MISDLRHLPSVDKVLTNSVLAQAAREFPHEFVVDRIRRELERARQAVTSGKVPATADDVAMTVSTQLQALQKPSLRRVINASGVILHTNLGRAPLSEEAIAAMAAAGLGYNNLEFDLESGNRGSRQVHIEGLLCELTGAEAALVVNNNAAAVLLGLSALAKRKEVIVSRGQAVEIGGGFRIPDVMRQSGAKLVEVGTTNCTYIRDFEQAITPHTAALLRVHSSNFKVVGFTSDVSIEELGSLGKKTGLPVLDDLGSGCFLDTTRFGLGPEPMVQQSLAAGSALVFFSGDKLVGGPQAGIIAGKKELVDKLKRHPLARAVRIDKVRLAGLAATLMHYLKGEAESKVPIWRMIAMPLAETERRSKLWLAATNGHAVVMKGETMVGGGSLPGQTLPTKLLAIGGGGKKGRSLAQALAQKLRSLDTPIIARISEDYLLLDPRTVLPEEDEKVVEGLRELHPRD